jgi:triacylglycerol lipase
MPTQGTGYTATRNPIVLIPGLLGFKSLLGIVDYFPGIIDALEEDGAQVFVAHVSQANDSITRAKEILPQLELLRAATGATKFNLIGHSQGAVDARYLAAIRPDLVASVTSVYGPNLGSPVAAWALTLPIGLGTGTIQALSDLFMLTSGSSDPNDAKAALEFLTPASMAKFDAQYPAGMPTTPCGQGNTVDNGIYYYSWGGQGWLTNPVDILDPDWMLLGGNDSESNDGLVGRCSTHLGQVIRDDYLGNHIDAVNMIAGLIAPTAPDPKTLFRLHANRLQGAGL